MTLTQNEATRFISIIDYRIEKALGRGTVVEMTYGDVETVSGNLASVYIGGDTNASAGFRIPAGMVVEDGDRVRVSIDPRGIRRVEEVLTTQVAARLAVDPVRGTIKLGDGTVAPVPGTEGQALLVAADGSLEFGTVTTDLSAYATDADLAAHEAASDPHTGYQKESEKGAAGGYVGLDGSGNVSISGYLAVAQGGADDGLKVGDDAVLFDADSANAFGIKGVSDAASGAVMFGSGKDTRLERHIAGRVRYTANGTANAAEFGVHGTSGQRAKVDIRVGTDTSERAGLFGDATMQGLVFGPGTSGVDVQLSRTAANVLELASGDKFVAPNIFGNSLAVTPVANTPTTASETFPASKTMTGSLFGASSADTTQVGNAWQGEAITSLSSTAITMYGYRTNTTSTTMWYVVIGI